jgi:hypothetical protein
VPAPRDTAPSKKAPCKTAPRKTAPRQPFEYAIVRVVPRVERGEAMNAGIVLMSRARRFLGARVELDEPLLVAIAHDCDPDVVRAHLAQVEAIADGDPAGGPIGRLSMAERFHWLVSPSSTIIQPSEVHTGLTDDPRATLDHLFRTLVRR